MEVVALAFWIGAIGWFFHRRQVRAAQAETELMVPMPETELWNPSPDQMPTQARRSEPVIPDKPTEHEPWSEVGVAGFALIALGVVVAMAILMFGLM
jgi:hypothetical protein